MNRREAINKVAWILGGAVIGGHLFLEGCTRTETTAEVSKLFEPDQIDFLGDVANAILPPTSSPGAKEAGVGEFIPVMVKDCYTPEDQEAFMSGLSEIDKKAQALFGQKFQSLSIDDQTAVVHELDQEAKAYHRSKDSKDPNHFFHLFKQLTLLGFFTSEIGATQALRYVRVPGRYDGDVPYKKGDRAWA